MRLRHSRPDDPGYSRTRHASGFRILDRPGKPLESPAELRRVEDLAVPPAWRDVWICRWPQGHLQAVGTDAAGRRQYLYHRQFRAEQERAKHDHVLEVARSLPCIRQTVEGHLAQRGLSRERVLATGVRLIDLGFFRIGNQRYTEQHSTYGLTTLRRDHVSCGAGQVTFGFPAKYGKRQIQAVADPLTCRAVRALKRRGGRDGPLLLYRQGSAWHSVTSEDLNAYLREAGGIDVTAKDFRTWHATVLAAVALAVSQPADRTKAARRRTVSRAAREVADYLGNTPAVCRDSYINPRVVELYDQGVTIAPVLQDLGAEATFGVPATRGAVERAVLRMLRTGRSPGE